MIYINRYQMAHMVKNNNNFLSPPRFFSHECMELNEVSRRNNDWQADYQQQGAGAFETWFDLYVSSNLRVSDQYCSREMLLSGIPPPGHAALALSLNPGKKGIFQGCEFGANNAGLIAPDAESFFRTPANLRMIVLTIPLSRFDQALHAAENKKELHHLIAQTPVTNLDSATMALLTRAAQHAINIVQSTPQPAKLAVCLSEIEEYIATAVGLALTTHCQVARGALARRNRLRCVIQARDYIEAHLDSPLGMETLTRVTGTSTRSLEMAFRETLNSTPVQYIRVRRLNAAKKHLRQADRFQTSVTFTAQALGFSHMSRFAQDYKSLFNEFPSETLAASA